MSCTTRWGSLGYVYRANGLTKESHWLPLLVTAQHSPCELWERGDVFNEDVVVWLFVLVYESDSFTNKWRTRRGEYIDKKGRLNITEHGKRPKYMSGLLVLAFEHQKQMKDSLSLWSLLPVDFLYYVCSSFFCCCWTCWGVVVISTLVVKRRYVFLKISCLFFFYCTRVN